MAELDLQLRRLADDVDWPETPAFDLRARARPRWPLVLAVAAALAVGLAFAVPQSRGALLRFLHLGAVRVERVDTLPSAQERSLRASLGEPITRGVAAALLGRPFALRDVRLYGSGSVVSTLLAGPLLLSAVRTGNDPVILKKFAGSATEAQGVELDGRTFAIWIHGGRHVFVGPTLPPRYAGNTLLWQREGITYRLEGPALTLAQARAFARRIF
jgi:hypothetical protein